MGDKTEDRVRVLGPFGVSTASADLEAFSSATALNAGTPSAPRNAEVPLAFLPTWLGLPTIKPALMDALFDIAGGDDGSLVHMHQDVTVHVPLEADHAYSLILTCRQAEKPNTIVIDGQVQDADEQLVAVMETKLLVAKASAD